MTRFVAYLAVVTTTILVAAFCLVVHRHHKTAATGVAGPSPVVVVARPVEHPSVGRLSHRRSGPRPSHVCTDTHWKRVLKPAERWIDAHESGLDPTSVEPTTGAFGLGQLLPETYAALGLPMSASPCAQIHAQRMYAHERYGSFANALRFWEANRWW